VRQRLDKIVTGLPRQLQTMYPEIDVMMTIESITAIPADLVLKSPKMVHLPCSSGIAESPGRHVHPRDKQELKLHGTCFSTIIATSSRFSGDESAHVT